MNTLNEGRNEIRFNNSNAQCLLENWVEERKVHEIYPQEQYENSLDFRQGHRGIFTKDSDEHLSNLTTIRESYRPPIKSIMRQRGRKEELMEQMFYEQATKEVSEDFNTPMEIQEYKSVMMNDYNKDDFVSVMPQATVSHDYKLEEPVTFWSEHRDRVTGVSQPKTRSPFKKNVAFSKSIQEYWNETRPYEVDEYPKM